MDDRMSISVKDYLRLIDKLARYEAALTLISTLGVGAYTDLDGWNALAKMAQRTALQTLNRN